MSELLIILALQFLYFISTLEKEKKFFLGDSSLFLGGIIAILLITANRYNMFMI